MAAFQLTSQIQQHADITVLLNNLHSFPFLAQILFNYG